MTGVMGVACGGCGLRWAWPAVGVSVAGKLEAKQAFLSCLDKNKSPSCRWLTSLTAPTLAKRPQRESGWAAASRSYCCLDRGQGSVLQGVVGAPARAPGGWGEPDGGSPASLDLVVGSVLKRREPALSPVGLTTCLPLMGLGCPLSHGA